LIIHKTETTKYGWRMKFKIRETDNNLTIVAENKINNNWYKESKHNNSWLDKEQAKELRDFLIEQLGDD